MSHHRTRPARQRELTRLAAQLGDDELDALVLLAHRALIGQARYGRLAVARDSRKFASEALEEVVDGMFYAAAALLQQRAQCRRHRARGDRHRG